MKRYTQIRYEERMKIAELKQAGLPIRHIARVLNRSPSTVSRELKRNEAPPGQYWPDRAETLSLKRRQRLCLLDRHQELRDFVVTQLHCHYWTPEKIAGFLTHRQKILPSISHESLYAWLYKPAQKKEKLWKFLPRHKAKRGLRKSRGAGASRIPNRVSIHQRPPVVAKGKQFGHWEGDLMSFCKNSQHILVLRERLTLYTLSVPLPSKKADSTAYALIALLEQIPLQARQTLTLDNGGEFAAHEQWLKQLNLPSFFCDPYASWQKGGIENTNGRLRRDLPRKTNILAMQKDDFEETIDNYNSTPRKSLKWLNPFQAFNKNLQRVALHS